VSKNKGKKEHEFFPYYILMDSFVKEILMMISIFFRDEMKYNGVDRTAEKYHAIGAMY
jgi:hypothetical protein